MPEVNIVRTIKPKKGLYIAEGRSEYVGKHPVGEGGSCFWVGFKIVWRGGFFRSESGLLVLPHFCLGGSSLSHKKIQSEARGGAFSAGPPNTPARLRAPARLFSRGFPTPPARPQGPSGVALYFN